MKVRNIIVSAAVLASSAVLAVSCNSQTEQKTKSIVVFYSQTGTTAKVAEQIISLTGADSFELQCETPYPDTYEGTIQESREECQNGTGRALVQSKVDLSGYDTVYVGYPIWYGTFAPPVVTFIKENDLSGKNVVLFCTYGSGGRKASERQFKDLCPEANVLGSYGIAARKIDIVGEDVAAFFESLGKPEGELVGAYSEFRPLEEDDLAVFNAVMENYAYLHVEPVEVSTQVVAGLNYIFRCKSVGPDGAESFCDAYIFRPLDGEPYLKEIER